MKKTQTNPKRKVIILDAPDALRIVKEQKNNLIADKVILLKAFNVDQVKSIDKNELSLTAIVSMAKPDRYGHTINPQGWDTKYYTEKNPVLLWGHDYSKPAIGKATRLSVNGTDGKMIAEFAFDQDDPEAVKIFNKYAKGVLNSFSVGFLVRKYGTAITEDDPDGFTFDEQELIEVSAVNVPAHQDANVMRDVAKSLQDTCNIMNECKDVEPEAKEDKKEAKKERKREVKEKSEITELKEQVATLSKQMESMLLFINRTTKQPQGNPNQAAGNNQDEPTKAKGQTLTIRLTEDEVKQLKANAQIVDKSNELNLRIVNKAIKTAQE